MFKICVFFYNSLRLNFVIFYILNIKTNKNLERPAHLVTFNVKLLLLQ